MRQLIIGNVVGSVVATRKNEKLIGMKLMIVEPIAEFGTAAQRFVAVDNVGAGIGEMVIVATGSAARIGCGKEFAPIDKAIVGIVDSGTGLVV